MFRNSNFKNVKKNCNVGGYKNMYLQSSVKSALRKLELNFPHDKTFTPLDRSRDPWQRNGDTFSTAPVSTSGYYRITTSTLY